MGRIENELSELDRLISSFTRFARDYPKGGYEQTLAKLQAQRAILVDTIGRKPKHT